MKPKKENLWYSLLLMALGLFAFRLSFMTDSRAVGIVLLAAGFCMVLGACIIFWKNFRE